MVQKWLKNGLITFLLAATSIPALAQESKPLSSTETTVPSQQPTFKKKVPYSAVGVFGADTTFGAPDSWIVPIARVIGYKEFNKLDMLAQADTLGVSLQADYRTNPGIGIKPHYDYIAHGDYRHFIETGKRLRAQEVNASIAGIDLFTTISSNKFTAKVTVGNGYKWYSPQTNTTITPPAAHLIQDFILDASYQNITTKELVIKDGLEASVQLALQSYGPDKLTQRAFGFIGYYYNSPYDYNLKLEARAGIEQGSDLQNAWYLGSFISRQAPLSGRGYMQFRQSQFVQAQASIGIPLTGSIRAEPGTGLVLFPFKNNTLGASPSDTVHPSLSLTLSGKIAGLLPLNVKYGYALPTQKLGASHELFVYTVVAWNKL